MTRVIEIFRERCDIDELMYRIKSLDDEKRSILLRSCIDLYMENEPNHGYTSMQAAKLIEELGFMDEIIFTIITKLVKRNAYYGKNNIEIYDECRYKYVIMNEITYALDESIDAILRSLNKKDRDTVLKDCICGLSYGMSGKDLSEFLVLKGFDPASIVIEYLEMAKRFDRENIDTGIQTIYVKRIE